MYRALAVSPIGEVALTVKEVAGEDWRGRVRISTDAMEELALKEGDVVEVEGSRLTAALAARGPPEDLGARAIRMDAWTARNAGVEAGGTVKVRKAKAAPAAVIVLETQTILEPSESFKSYVKSRLLGRPVVAGDVVPVNVLGTIYEFKVASTEPSGAVVVDESSRLTVVTKTVGIAALAAKERARVGERVPVVGVAYPQRPGLPVKVSYRKPSGAWITRELETAEDGVFTDSFVVDEAGAWVVKAEGGRSTLFAFVFVEG
jgi:hypothetical protein